MLPFSELRSGDDTEFDGRWRHMTGDIMARSAHALLSIFVSDRGRFPTVALTISLCRSNGRPTTNDEAIHVVPAFHSDATRQTFWYAAAAAVKDLKSANNLPMSCMCKSGCRNLCTKNEMICDRQLPQERHMSSSFRACSISRNW